MISSALERTRRDDTGSSLQRVQRIEAAVAVSSKASREFVQAIGLAASLAKALKLGEALKPSAFPGIATMADFVGELSTAIRIISLMKPG